MALESGKFITDKEELKPGLIIFRRSDVKHRRWYCRVKVVQDGAYNEDAAGRDEKDKREKYKDKYKTVSLKTDDVDTARKRAWHQDGEVRYALKYDGPIFNRPFREVAKEYQAKQEVRVQRGEITTKRLETIGFMIDGPLNDYVGSIQVHLIGDERWGDYPVWRRTNGEGLVERNGARMVTAEIATRMVAANLARVRKAQVARGTRPKVMTSEAFDAAVQAKMAKPVPYVSDDTIRLEMKVFSAIMNFAIKKRYVSASQRFDEIPALKTMQREEFTVEEYRKLHTKGRKWITTTYEEKDGKKVAVPTKPAARWYRTMTYNMVLIACNTGMRPAELKNLRWRDVWPAKDREGRDIFVLFVQGKGKSRKLVAPKSVGDYLERVREQVREANRRMAERDAGETSGDLSYDPKPDDRVFTTITGKPAKTLYGFLIASLLDEANLRKGADGTVRTTYCFRHTYATFRLQMGVDVYFLAEQMGTTVQMIEKHYGHVNTIRHADRVLMGMEGWDPVVARPDEVLVEQEATAKAAQAAKMRQSPKPRPSKR